MNKTKSILMTLIIFSSLIISSCNMGSVKGKWTDADKQKFNKEMETVDLSNLGDKKAKWIESYLNKVEVKYSNFDEADKDEPGCKVLALEVSNELLSNGSVKGKWSDIDKQAFNKELESVDLSNLGDKKTQWIQCYFSKAEAKYSSLYEANADEPGCKELAEQCNNDIMK